MNSQGRREKLKTVEILVTLLLSNPALTRKDIMDLMTGNLINGGKQINIPDWLTVTGKDGLQRPLSRQSVYKALDFIKESGILHEEFNTIGRIKMLESNPKEIKINKYTIKSVILSIDMDQVREKYKELWIQEFRQSVNFNVLPEKAKTIVIKQMEKRFIDYNTLDGEEENELIDFENENIGNDEADGISEYMKLQNIDYVMEYLKMYEKNADKFTL
jgi:hypothetical protein